MTNGISPEAHRDTQLQQEAMGLTPFPSHEEMMAMSPEDRDELIDAFGKERWGPLYRDYRVGLGMSADECREAAGKLQEQVKGLSQEDTAPEFAERLNTLISELLQRAEQKDRMAADAIDQVTRMEAAGYEAVFNRDRTQVRFLKPGEPLSAEDREALGPDTVALATYEGEGGRQAP